MRVVVSARHAAWVLEGLPCTQKFDKEARETLLDVFRDAVDFWSERRVPYRVFYSFA
jgi:hypothetical protein